MIRFLNTFLNNNRDIIFVYSYFHFLLPLLPGAWQILSKCEELCEMGVLFTMQIVHEVSFLHSICLDFFCLVRFMPLPRECAQYLILIC